MPIVGSTKQTANVQSTVYTCMFSLTGPMANGQHKNICISVGQHSSSLTVVLLAPKTIWSSNCPCRKCTVYSRDPRERTLVLHKYHTILHKKHEHTGSIISMIFLEPAPHGYFIKNDDFTPPPKKSPTRTETYIKNRENF
jgi:hypothetical protein